MSKVAVKITAEGVKGAEDGQNTKPYNKDEVYEVCQELAEIWIEGGLAEPVKGKAKAKPEEKAVDPAPENKAVQSSDENKEDNKDPKADDSKEDKPKEKAKK